MDIYRGMHVESGNATQRNAAELNGTCITHQFCHTKNNAVRASAILHLHLHQRDDSIRDGAVVDIEWVGLVTGSAAGHRRLSNHGGSLLE
jgi:hypothetical protein